jgi:hypothetical protein
MNAKLLGVTGIPLLILVATLAACGGGGGGSDGASIGGSAGSGTSAGGGGNAGSGGGATTNSSTSKDVLPSTDTTLTGKETPPPETVVAQTARAADPPPGTVQFFATFPDLWDFRSTPWPAEGTSNDGMWWVEQKAPGRAQVVYGGRDGGTALRLHTEPWDTYVSGSDTHERNDVALQYNGGWQGDEQWWAHSILFPDDFAVPPWDLADSRAVVFDFHDTRNQGGQANFHVVVEPGGHLRFRGHGGPQVVDDVGNQYSYGADIGDVQKNVWYDFVYHVKWSAYGDGFIQAWVNGRLVLDHYGPTLYEGYGVTSSSPITTRPSAKPAR